MNIQIKHLNRLALLACAPFIGMLIWVLSSSPSVELSQNAYPQPSPQAPLAVEQLSGGITQGLDEAKAIAGLTAESIKKSAWLYDQTNKDMSQIVKTANAQASRPAQIYDRRITRKLGSPSDVVQSDKLRAQLFYVRAANFKGYALKVKLKSPDAMKMVLGNDTFGGAETTLSAVKRHQALAGVNAGGFADQRGKRYPLSTTMMDGKYVNGFEPSFADLFFVGLNKSMQLVGGKYMSREQLDKEEPVFGATFVPVLLKDGLRQAIPLKWQVSPKRAPRTVVANYKDDQLLFLVTDGADESGRSGATLAEMQILLQRFGAVDAYNLDGGGSSSMIFKGRVVNAPSDGTLRKLSTHFLFFD
ncbi:phosphodiester glycosidase family protein [Paenibacillus abyssi]|uniref:Phosphodiester glycosidase domain-containing protein n=1 Tax=Paenibacillus abyssi TaxID=1340531 RepID=A0A917G4I8_9BACL|nr:phosphodiester glycosidase family protein [Paenibacillus abyssi]GGG21402.1 hypothetical protein GCM10010916_42640 [Paenibacillus abyssi]